MTQHLDLGCGPQPRNPYAQAQVFGIDIRRDMAWPSAAQIHIANLSLQPIPFEANCFDSVSAYDFFEHVPRVSLDPAQGSTRFPFIELMNEVWRVLRPGGLLYAITPAYPHEKAFRDPTHVNIIAGKTYRYFCAPHLLGAMYGFQGRFELVRQVRLKPRGNYEPPGVAAGLRRVGDRLLGRASHLVWELRAVK